MPDSGFIDFGFCRGLAAILCLVLCMPGSLRAGPERDFQELKTEYFKLRNTDVNIDRQSDWQDLSTSFEQFVLDEPDDENAPSALFNAALLNEELYRKTNNADRLARASHLFERIYLQYAQSDFADDALIKRGDLMRFSLSDTDQAEKCYSKVLESYPQSDMAEVAKVKLKSLKSPEPRTRKNEIVIADESVPAGNGPLVVIDPGHGGEDLGAVGPGGLLEKDVVLAIGLELRTLLESQLGARVKLTRTKDIFVPLVERTELANRLQADLFVSLHTNASPNGKAKGFETYYLDNSNDQSSKKLAERENASIRFEGTEGDLQYMLSDLIQSAKQPDSILLANSLQRATVSKLAPKWKMGKSLGVKKAPFYVLVGAHMPCVLVEMFFIDNSEEGPQLAKKEFRKELAEGLFVGIKGYFEKAKK